LTGWSDRRHPPGARKDPMVWVPYGAALAYCESFGGTLSTSSIKKEDAPKLEWRTIDGKPHLVQAGGKSKTPKKPMQGHSDVGFRCE